MTYSLDIPNSRLDISNEEMNKLEKRVKELYKLNIKKKGVRKMNNIIHGTVSSSWLCMYVIEVP